MLLTGSATCMQRLPLGGRLSLCEMPRACHQSMSRCIRRLWCSIEPNHGSGQVNGTQKVARCLVITRSNGPVLLETRKEVLDQVACLVQMPVTLAWLLVR